MVSRALLPCTHLSVPAPTNDCYAAGVRVRAGHVGRGMAWAQAGLGHSLTVRRSALGQPTVGQVSMWACHVLRVLLRWCVRLTSEDSSQTELRDQ